MSTVRYQVAVPSYQRAETLRDKTLKTLSEGGVSAKVVKVFVASESEAERYRSILTPGTYSAIVVAEVGMNVVRNHITKHYPEGTRLVEFDDDIKGVRRAVGNPAKLERVADLHSMIVAAFEECRRSRARLWGLYPVCNAMFMRVGQVTHDLRPIIGTVWGRVVDHSIPDLVCEVKSDVERTMQYWVRDGRVVRFNGLSPVQNARTEPGGQQSPGRRTLEKSRWAAEYLCRTYPGLCVPKRSFKGGHAEVRLCASKTEENMARVPVSKAAPRGATVRGEVVMADLADLRPNSWNPNTMSAAMKASLKDGLAKDGWLASQALLVWGTDEKGNARNIIIDGEHRWNAASELGMKTGPVVVLHKLTERAAKGLTVKLDQKRGTWDPKLLTDLMKELSDGQDDVRGMLTMDYGFDSKYIETHLGALLDTMLGVPEPSRPPAPVNDIRGEETRIRVPLTFYVSQPVYAQLERVFRRKDRPSEMDENLLLEMVKKWEDAGGKD